MPYIKQSKRMIFDNAVILAQGGNLYDAKSVIVAGMREADVFLQDGYLNYAFTQLLRKVEDLTDASEVIFMVLHELFLEHPRYFLYQRVIGLLECMMNEFKRRGWREEAILVINHLKEFVIKQLDEYEDDKIKQNGDI